jgi:hypothetical protein
MRTSSRRAMPGGYRAAWAALQRFLSELFAGSLDRGPVSWRFESESGTN